MEGKSNFVFDDRRKSLSHTMVDEIPLFGKEEYGNVIKKTEVISSEEGTVRVLVFLENQEKSIQTEIQRLEDQLKVKKENLDQIKGEIRDLKKAVGSRINFEKVKKQLEKKDKEKEKLEKK